MSLRTIYHPTRIIARKKSVNTCVFFFFFEKGKAEMSPFTCGFFSRSRCKWRVELQPQFYTQKDTCDGVDEIGKLAGLAAAPPRSALRKSFREFFRETDSR